MNKSKVKDKVKDKSASCNIVSVSSREADSDVIAYSNFENEEVIL